MYKICFTELNFMGFESKKEIEVESHRVTKNQNGTYNIICFKGKENLIFNNCSYPKRIFE